MHAPRQMILCLVGLPGSGKSHLARHLESQGWFLVDDPSPQGGLTAVDAAVASGRNVVITDPHFCLPGVRAVADTYLRRSGAEVIWEYFENDPEACRRNVAHRNDGRAVESTIRLYSGLYQIPEGARVRPVWRG
jgi:predicted kinase